MDERRNKGRNRWMMDGRMNTYAQFHKISRIVYRHSSPFIASRAHSSHIASEPIVHYGMFAAAIHEDAIPRIFIVATVVVVEKVKLLWHARDSSALILGRSRAPRRRRRETGGEGRGGGRKLLIDRVLRTAEWHAGHETAGIRRCMSRAAGGWPRPMCVGSFKCFGPSGSGAALPAYSGSSSRELTRQDISGMEGHAEGYHPQAWSLYL
eukprot:scaffold254058_cov18-Prasinocladus_malaysianus.AAC.1